MVIVLLSLFITTTAPASPSSKWLFHKSENNIVLHYREHAGGLVEIRAQTFIPTSYSAFLLLLEDEDNVPRWIDNVSSAQVLKQISPTENIVYTRFDAPWPAKDRDMVTYSKFSRSPFGFVLTITDAPASALETQPGFIRIRRVKASWTLEKLTNNTTHIEYRAFADPSGALPNWLVNQLALDSAYQTFLGLQRELPKYQGKTHPYVEE
ncbi:START domain-containing protein [Vibrio sp. CAU 1672]|uniref:START domain-containing protein n=1 Tax=Vibrio sp. CAU 1672 TaxID=3032594 RepID=UPI0023DCBBB2|nr:START domain-containing protein [Vibrio sp. CAU 1672]MDF2155379.1 START domain-containing protein [Vibrio sp. CAU 1672]